MKRLLGRLVKIGIVLGVLGGLAYAAKKLMGGLGPEPGSDTAPKAWPSLIPEPAADASEPSGTNGGESGGSNGSAPAASAAEA